MKLNMRLLLIISLAVAIVGGDIPPADGQVGPIAVFDLDFAAGTLGNPFDMINIWDFNEQWTAKASSHPADYFSKNYPFVKRVQLMSATGGSAAKDLFVDPYDRTTFDDYKFGHLLLACENIVKQGLKPYIVTGNVPLKFSSVPVISEKFGVNVRPPDDDKYDEYYRYIKAIGSAVAARFGTDEVKTWTWGVLTEYENKDWFQAADKTSQSTKTAYFKLYDYTCAALTDALGSENLVIGAHSMTVDEGLWDEREFIDHCAKGINYKTGGIGSQINFLSVSYYDYMPGVFAARNLQSCIRLLRERAIQNGLLDLRYGVDEGRILRGPDDKPLSYCLLAHSYQGAADIGLYRTMAENDIAWFSTWLLNSNGIWNGVNSVSTNIALLVNQMAGSRYIPMRAAGTAKDPNNRILGFGGYDKLENKLYIAVANFNPDITAVSSERVDILLENVTAASGAMPVIRKWVVDNESSSWWAAWLNDQQQYEMPDQLYMDGKSRYTAGVPLALVGQDARAFWYEKADAYQELAALKPDSAAGEIVNQSLSLSADLAHHGVVFYEIGNVAQTAPGPRRIAYEGFDAPDGTLLRTMDDSGGGWAGGWMDDVSLTRPVSERFLVKDGVCRVTTASNSEVLAAYRGLAKGIDLDVDRDYYLRWDQGLTHELAGEFRYQKVDLHGADTAICFGFINEKPHEAVLRPFMKIGELKYDLDTSVHLEQMYTIVVKISARAAGKDQFYMKIYPKACQEPGGWNIESDKVGLSKAVTGVVDVIDLIAGMGRSGNTAYFDDFLIEAYGQQAVEEISGIEDALRLLLEEPDNTQLYNIVAGQIAALGGGIAKMSLENRLKLMEPYASIPYFTQNGKQIFCQQPGEFSCTVNIYNDTNKRQTHKAQLIVATYHAHTHAIASVKMDFNNEEIAPYHHKTLSLHMTMPTSGYYTKVYVWNGSDILKPYTKYTLLKECTL